MTPCYIPRLPPYYPGFYSVKTSPLNIESVRIAYFLLKRQEKGDLPEAKVFIANLERLQTAVNPDRTDIVGVERIFNNAEERVSKNENPSGHYFEARLGIAFLNAGFKVKEISAKKSLEERNGQSYIQKREVDFVVIKDGIKYYVEATKHIGRVIEADKKNQKTEFLIQIAGKYGAVPIRILDSKVFSEHDKRQIIKYLERFPQLRFWKAPEDRYQTIEDLDIISARELVNL